ncbi:MAG: hypothetical protein OEZ06_10705 [Myxococcales bacterium]|nr:hypothetical protein [Myxococcales bacterium]
MNNFQASKAIRFNLSMALVLFSAMLLLASGVSAQESASMEADLSSAELEPSGGEDNSSAFLLAGKVGGIASFNGLDPFVHGGIELGWVFGGTGRSMAALLQVEYAVPPAAGSVTEEGLGGDADAGLPPRVPDETYKWKIVQKELVFQPTFMYRLTGISGSITPYAGIGPRIYLLESVVWGTAGDKDGSGTQPIGDTYERSTKWGLGVPLGAELALGPGGLFAELLFQWGPFEHETTGKTHLGGGSLFLGYRALL